MNPIELKIIESLVLLLVLVVIRYVVSKLIISRYKRANFDITRKQLTIKVLNILFFMILGLCLIVVWGLTGQQVIAGIGSVITLLGVAFFAQWSLLSNITSGLILFFNHPLKIGDYVEIVDKDFPMAGRVENITLFFLHLRNKDNHVYTLANTIVAQKTMRIMEPEEFFEAIENETIEENKNTPSDNNAQD
ncbi:MULTISPECIES: mechanosensitive ion channel domain-containing protein [Leeuwenhoekiella]|uniref:Small-conductance mechanosensitive channel n=1 Tax=Leeuwenhoekiella blandensis (strain CECT 7118 / CCUG 51940 / KCTC 22103 / MED217) TaxID=398720 RepID=A3XLR3_LEEBM|nr:MULTISPECIES: mechanosensitive ion channel domain-containing protein [Leeuwenhoekiella]EAQ49511.1 Small-conductance mechanosensitive channel [Leeuwenhoekiella blandensis MED217]MAO44388.1 mechanosensitive ion channel protein MscS [Leeuwenhoekiella sp.]MBQ52105.1 mechanosensitive ion channel protein MscS [Leeuwenhoekiella sp.]HBT09601.1 mechanosensitive ion channel protein MscS [Leeuwenhoekiella sp.]